MSEAPADVTELGAIAYRLDTLCSRLFGEMGEEFVRPFWDVISEIVAYDVAHPSPSAPDNTDSTTTAVAPMAPLPEETP